MFERLDPRIRSLPEDPRPRGSKKLSGKGKRELYRVRVGDYRIVYSVDEDARCVTVVRVRHRREVYRD